jgi:hypothetical protein
MSNIPIKFVNEEMTDNKMGLLKRVINVITSPEKVMDNLAERPRVIFPLILTAVSLIALLASRMELYKESLRQPTELASKLTERLTGKTMTPELLEQSISKALHMSFITVPIAALFGWLFITVIFFTIFKIFGGKGKFKNYLSITGYAYVILALYYLIVFAASFFTGSIHQDIPLTSLATLFDTSMRGNFLFGILKGLDIFKIWYYAVIAIGLVKVSGFKKNTVYAIVAGVFIIGLLIAGASELSAGAMLK